jgi:hypothetical protein
LKFRFGDHPVDFMGALPIGGFSRILVDFPVDFSVIVSEDWLWVGFDFSIGLDRADTAISHLENSLLRPRLHQHIDCWLPSLLGSIVTWISEFELGFIGDSRL